MMKLIQNIDVYAPQHLGTKDVLVINDKIVKIADAGTILAEGFLADAEVIDGSNLLLTPGFIDSHVHVLGGGGEGGFANRTPEATLEGLTKFGVTTVVGCLGTDGIGRDMCALVAKTKGLNEQGMSAYCYTGSYQIPGSHTDRQHNEGYHDDPGNHRNRRNRYFGSSFFTADI